MKFTLFSKESINKLLQQYLDRGQWSKATEQYKRLIKLHPENINLRLRMAEVCLKARNKKGALEQYQIVAEHYISLENLSRAVTILRTMLNIDSGLSHIRIKLAEVYASLGDTEEMWNQYLTAFKYLEEKKLVVQSISVLEQMAKLKLEDSKLMIQLADMFLTRNLRPQAVSQFLSIAEFFLQENQLEVAIKYYKQALNIDASNIEALKGLEVLHRLDDKLTQLTPAIEEEEGEEVVEEEIVLEEASTFSATTPEPITQKPPEKEEVEEAVSPFKATTPESVTQKPPEEELDDLLAQAVNQRTTSEDDWENHYNLGRVYQEMALLDAAIEEFVCAASDPNLQGKCYQSLSKCFEQKGMARQAEKYQQMCLNLSLSEASAG